MNPLLQNFDTPFSTVPFKQINKSDYIPALQEAIKESKDRLDQMKNNTSEVTFENSLLILETCSEQIDIIAHTFFNLHSAESDEELRDLAKDISPLLTEFSNDIALDEKIFSRVKQLYEKRSGLNLNTEQKMVLDKSYKSFIRNGALLDNDKKEQLREYDKEVSQLSLVYSDNVLKATHEYILEITNENDLAGLPDFLKKAAKEEAISKEKPNSWVFTMDFPSFVPFMKYSDKRELRKEMAIAYRSRAFNDKFDNTENVKRIATIRHLRAQLLGYKTHANYVLEERMAQNPESVKKFLDNLLTKSKPAMQNDLKELKEFAKKLDNVTDFQSWDNAYYSEKLKKEKFNIDDELLKPYFQLENVVQGAFDIATKLYNISFKEINNVETYHEDVKTYEVTDSQTKEHVGIFYTDFFPREGKRNGAWMTNFREQGLYKNNIMRPHVAIVCNFTKPSKETPSLLTFDEVRTLFHEFGHALHGLLSNCTYTSVASPNVYWDFVELPSQIMENWILEKEALDIFAKHYKNGVNIPMEYVEKIKESSKFQEGLATIRQLSFGLLDMSWHSKDPKDINDVEQHENQAMAPAQAFEDIPGTNMSCSFGHIFSGGYSSGYYSYKWAEVLDADAFELFKEKGIFNKEVSESFKNNILAKGGSEHPMELYKRFRGKEPSPDALLRRGGLIK